MSEGLLGPRDVSRIATHLGITPKKSRGQNFVTDHNTIRKIVALAELTGTEDVLEIGPGLGSLTLGLLPQAAHVTAVEIDPALAGQLETTVRAQAIDQVPKLNVIQADARDWLRQAADIPDVQPTVLAANLPYNLAVPLVLDTLEYLPSVTHGVVMVQKEVAERMCAHPGDKTYGIPSLKCAWYADMKLAATVPASVFWPVPRVNSALVTFRRHHRHDPQLRVETFAAIDAAFRTRRKTLRQSLAAWEPDVRLIEDWLAQSGISPQRRGETLTIDEFQTLANRKVMGVSL